MGNENKTAEIDDTDTSLTIAAPWKYELKYFHIFFHIYFHLAGAYGVYLTLTSAKWTTILFAYIMILISALGVYAGAHRHFAHKSYKATKSLQIFLMLCHCTAYQRDLVLWILDHRLHHKYSDTDADPHNPSRGFFFSHIGWVYCKKHPESLKRIKNIDMSDVYSNPVIMFQKKYQHWLIPGLCFVLPTLIPIFFWDETFSNSWHVNALKYIISMHVLFFVNSIAHRWGYRPYDKNICPAESKVMAMLTFGEGFHNYHHVFPNDYRGAEIGGSFLNLITYFIDICAYLGLAYDLKTVSKDVIKSRMERTGEGSELLKFEQNFKLDGIRQL